MEVDASLDVARRLLYAGRAMIHGIQGPTHLAVPMDGLGVVVGLGGVMLRHAVRESLGPTIHFGTHLQRLTSGAAGS